MNLSTLKEIQKIYQKGSNISQFLREQEKSKSNSTDIIQVVYDFQAGSYIKHNEKDDTFIKNWTKAIANEIEQLDLKPPYSLMEAGVGEATTLWRVVSHLKKNISHAYGFDISWSRLRYGLHYLQKHRLQKNTSLFLGDLFSIPLSDNAIDVVYTAHSIEPNGGKEKEILQELYRVTSKYLVLLEPDYGFAAKDARERMKRHRFIRRLPQAAKELGYNIIEHRKFELASNPLNPTGLLIIKKKPRRTSFSHQCPISKEKLIFKRGAFFSPKGLLAYPILDGVPCLLPQNALVATHFDDFI